MATRSAVLWATSTVGKPSPVVYTCPAGSTVILKTAIITLQVGTAQDVALSWQRTSPLVTLTIATQSLPAWNSLEWNGWIVLEPGDQVVLTFTVGPVLSAGFGAELPSP